jgi:hypothetical protein
MMKNGKCVPAPGYEFVGQHIRLPQGDRIKCPLGRSGAIFYPNSLNDGTGCTNGYINDKVGFIYCYRNSREVFNNKGECVDPSEPLWK